MDRNFGIRLKILLITSVLLSVTLSSCHNSRTSRIIADPNNLSYLYNPSKNAINPRFKVTTYSDNNALLMVKLFSGEMLFSQANESGIPQSLIEISTKLYQTTSGMVLVDTSYSDLRVNINDQLSEYILKYPFLPRQKQICRRDQDTGQTQEGNTPLCTYILTPNHPITAIISP